MEISEDKYREIENDLIKLCNTVAIPRFIKALRNAVHLGLFEQRVQVKGVEITEKDFDFNQEFVDWISYGNLNTDFETKALNNYPLTRQVIDAVLNVAQEEILDEDIPF